MADKDGSSYIRPTAISPPTPPHPKPTDLKGATHRLKAYALKKYRRKLRAAEFNNQIKKDQHSTSLTENASDSLPQPEDFTSHAISSTSVDKVSTQEENIFTSDGELDIDLSKNNVSTSESCSSSTEGSFSNGIFQ